VWLAALGILLLPVAAIAQVGPVGNQFQVNTYTLGAQGYLAAEVVIGKGRRQAHARGFWQRVVGTKRTKFSFGTDGGHFR
jgi:hypothetical protein